MIYFVQNNLKFCNKHYKLRDHMFIESRDFFISLMELIKITCSLTNKMLALIIMVRQRGPTISEASIQTNKQTQRRSHNAVCTNQHLHWLKTKEASHYSLVTRKRIEN